MRRRWLLLAIAAVIVAVSTGAAWIDHRNDQSAAREREQEWRHGGDGIAFRATVTITAGDAVPSDTLQKFVVRTTWTGDVLPDGKFNFFLRDRRGVQPRPFFSADSWDWNRAYEALSQHYPWLADTSVDHVTGGAAFQPVPINPLMERANLAFFSDTDEDMVTAEVSDLELVVFLVDVDGEVRWAKGVPLTASSS